MNSVGGAGAPDPREYATHLRQQWSDGCLDSRPDLTGALPPPSPPARPTVDVHLSPGGDPGPGPDSCPRGHPWTPQTTAWHSRGQAAGRPPKRVCRTCDTLRHAGGGEREDTAPHGVDEFGEPEGDEGEEPPWRR